MTGYLDFINLVSFFVIIFSLTLSFSKNSDLFSPVKLYCLFSLFFYLDIYFSDYNEYVSFIYLCQNILLALCVYLEPRLSRKDWEPARFENVQFQRVVFFVWLLTIIPVYNQLSLIRELGGLLNSFGNIAVRVKYFEGKGYLLVINSLIIFLNLIYFCAVITRPSFKSVCLYLLHFSILVGIGLLSGSRSFIVMTILVTVVISNYYYKRTSVSFALVSLLVMVVLVGVIGSLRNNISVSSGELSVGNFDIYSQLEVSHFKYGLIPLSIITESDVDDLQYGKTYMSLITNFVPRSLYPEKLESGGIFFTKKYAGDAWGGYSNLATGAVTEGIINFGSFFGVIVGVLGIFIFYVMGIKIYSIFLRRRADGRSFLLVIPYIYFILLAARYSYSEFSYVLFSYFLNVAAPCLCFWLLYRFSIRSRGKYG